MGKQGAKRSTPINSNAHACEACDIFYIRPGGLMGDRCGRHDENAPNHTIGPSRLPCEEPLPHITRCCGSRQVEKHGIQAEHQVSEGPDLRLVNLFLELTGHGPRSDPCYPHDRHHRYGPRAGTWMQFAWIRACSTSRPVWRRLHSLYAKKG